MKRFIATSLMSLVLSTSAFAIEDLNIDIQDQDAAYLARLTKLEDAQVATKPAPLFATVQPTAYLTFNAYSCGRRSFVAEVKDTQSVFFVAIKDTKHVDCRALARKHSYNIQIASDSINKPVVVLNPVLQKMLPAVDRPRMCTQDAGMLRHPVTGHCAGYTDGCQRHELLQNGYTETGSMGCVANLQ